MREADDETRQRLRGLEERLLDPEVRRSARDVADLLADDLVEIGASGRLFDKRAVLEALAGEEPLRRSMTGFRAALLAPGVVLATYRVDAVAPSTGAPSASLRSSIWQLQAGRWRMVFHQGTGVA